MKRILIVVSMLLLAGTARALTLSVGNGSGSCGATVSVPVSVDSATSMLSLEFRIAYDATQLSSPSVANGPLTSGFSSAANANGGVLHVAMANGTPVSGGGVVATITFTVAANAAGTVVLTPSGVLVNDVAQTGTPGSVQITCVHVPAAPTLVSPANGATAVASPVMLQWSAVDGATSYVVAFATTPATGAVGTVTSTSFQVNVLPGTTYYWAVQAVNSAGATWSPTATFTTAGAPCPTPGVPQLTGPDHVTSGDAFVLAWNRVDNATEYVLDESASPAFDGATTTSTTATSVTLTRTSATAATRYFRVHARVSNPPCVTDGATSNVVAVLVAPRPTVPASTRILPIVGTVDGQFGSSFRTSIQLNNPGDAPITGRIVFHPQGGADASLAYSLAPRQTVAYRDFIAALGAAHSIGSADIVPDAGSTAPVSLVRVFNDAGAAGTTGFTEDQVAPADAIQCGERAVLIAPADSAHMRMNVGIRTLLDGATITATVRASDGFMIQSSPLGYGPTTFAQIPLAQLAGGSLLLGNETVIVEVTAGSAIVYGSIIDNITQDPSFQLGRPVNRGSAAPCQ